MKIKISQPLTSYNGDPIRTGANADSEQATLKGTLELALVNCNAPEYATGEKKYELYRLLQKIHGAKDEMDLTAEEISTLKKVAGGMLGVVVVGAVYDALEGRGKG